MRKICLLIVAALSGSMAYSQLSCNADFTFSPSPDNNQKIVFQNISSVTGVGAYHFNLDLGDGTILNYWLSTGTGQPLGIIHDYGTTGTWNAKLIVSAVDTNTNAIVCTDSVSKTITITGNNKCDAAFTYTTSVLTPTTVNFQNTSVNNLTVPYTAYYEWDFGDGNTSNAINPTHNYAFRGTVYPVNLKAYYVENSTTDTLLYDSYTMNVRTWVDSCFADFSWTVDSTNYLKVDFNNLSHYQISPGPQYLISYEWSFGDGITSTAVNPSHTYSQHGRYWASLSIMALDSITADTLCYDFAGYIINARPPITPFCHAEYSIDTVNSGNGILYIINTSTPAHNDPNYTVTYGWEFGDGDTSSQAFPTHSYAHFGAYTICLTVTYYNVTNGDYCTDKYCDMAGLDSLNNVLYKTNSGFILKVSGPTVGEKEDLLTAVEIYPNPASNFINVKGLTGQAHWEIYSLNVSSSVRGKIEEGDGIIKLPGLPNGIYILSIEEGDGFVHRHQLMISK